MSSTREYRNACAIEVAVAIAADVLATAEALYDALGSVLPDDFPVLDFEPAQAQVRKLIAQTTT